MLKNKTRAPVILLAALSGGFLGFLLPALAPIGPLLSAVPELGNIFFTTVAGMAVGAAAASLALSSRNTPEGRSTDDHLKIKLREEQLEITKERVRTADLRLRKETITDEKQITVPVTRENLVVEQKEAGGAAGEGSIMRIPLSEEQVEVVKHPRRLNQVKVSKKASTETETVEETLKKEKLTTGTKGDAKIREK